MNKENLQEYAELKIKGKAIDERLKELNPLVLKDILAADVDKVPTSLGNFNIKKRKVWAYSGVVEELLEQLKKRKEAEEAEGIATFVEVEQLEFREAPKS